MPQPHLIGVISDTHGLLRPEAAQALRGCELIIHAGDVDKPEILSELRSIAPTVAVRGNVDHGIWAQGLPRTRSVEVGGARLCVIHNLADLSINPSADGFAAVISGHLKQGSPYNGEVRYDSEGRATNVLCTVENPLNRYDLGFDISYLGNTRHLAHVLRTIRNAGRPWRRLAEYKVLDVSAVPASLSMDEFWTGFTNQETRVVVYDPETKERRFLNRNAVPLATGIGYQGATSDIPRGRKSLIIALLAVVTVTFGVVALIKLKKKARMP